MALNRNILFSGYIKNTRHVLGPLVHWKIGWQWNEKKIIWFVPKQMMHKNPLKTIKMVQESVVVLNSDLITECKEPMTGQLNCLEPSAVRVSKELYYWTWGAVIYSHLSAEYCQRCSPWHSAVIWGTL